MQDYQLSQFRPNESQRSRNVPDVLFVDEEGNPIEAGEENLIFVDETGLEITEDKAINLIESGNFIDSRILYDDDLGPYNRSNSASFHASANSISNLTTALMAKSNSMLQAQKSNSLTHAQIQAVQAAQIAHTQALINAAPTASLLPNDIADVFARAHSKAQEQAAELAEIEADAASYNHAVSYQQVEKTKSDRRLPIRPEKKNYENTNNGAFNEETYELDKIINEHEKKMKNSSSYLSTKLNKVQQNSQEENIQQKLHEQIQRKLSVKEEEEREYIKELLLQKQAELMEQHMVEKKQLEKEEKRRVKAERKAKKEAEKRRKEAEKREEAEEKLRLDREMEQKRLLAEEARLEKKLREMERKREEKEERERNDAEIRKLHRYQNKKSFSTLAPSVSGISKASSITKISQKSSSSSFVRNHNSSNNIYNDNGYSRQQASSISTINKSDYRSHTTEKSQNYYNNRQMPGSYLMDKTRKSIEAYTKDYDVVQVRQVGQLKGRNLIRDYSNVDLDQFEKYYESGHLEFEPHHLDAHSTQFIDPFSADLFKDEMVDIDFGAIDAFTEALNAQILAEKNNSEPAKNLHFPSHIIASNHAAFLDTQTYISGANCNENGDENSGVNVQFIKPNLKSKTSDSNGTGASLKATRDEYARNNFFGSVVDVQAMSKNSDVSGLSGGSFIQNQLNKHHNVSYQSMVR